MKKKTKILILIIADSAANSIKTIISKIPCEICNSDIFSTEILIIDDKYTDDTTELSQRFKKLYPKSSMSILHSPVDQGYGENRKLGYQYGIDNNFDIIVLLHENGQYNQELLIDMINPILDNEAEIVFESRMLNNREAIKKVIPLHKLIGMQTLNRVQNLILKSNLSEFYTGYGAYKVEILKKIPFMYNSNNFAFNIDILIQFIDKHCKIKEIRLPTLYRDKFSYAKGIKYIFNMIKASLLARIQKYNIYYHPKFDYENENTTYASKLEFTSSHKFAVDYINSNSVVVDIGCGPGFVANALVEKGCIVHGFDQFKQNTIIKKLETYHVIDCDNIASTFEFKGDRLDAVLLLDIIEHLKDPEAFLWSLRNKISNYEPEIIITTANIAFIVTRTLLFFGQFNYGKKGILDISHKRLFTFKQLKRSLINSGYNIRKTTGIPVPFPLVFGNNIFSKFLLLINLFLIKIWKGLFSYQIAIIASPQPTLETLLKRSKLEKMKK